MYWKINEKGYRILRLNTDKFHVMKKKTYLILNLQPRMDTTYVEHFPNVYNTSMPD